MNRTHVLIPFILVTLFLNSGSTYANKGVKKVAEVIAAKTTNKEKNVASGLGIFLNKGYYSFKSSADTTPRVISADYTKVAGPRSQMWRECIGAARAAEGLRADWQEHLKMVQDEIGFRSLRFHGIFTDEMGVYTEDKQGNPVYNWQYVDKLYDALLSMKIRPFVELGFMPKALASDLTKKVFWWEGNPSLPKDWQRWQDFITAFVTHLNERYGREEVAQWNFEVWNEPDLTAFLYVPKDQDRKAAYYNIYDKTVRAVKKANPGCQVGGPAVSHKKDWITDLIAYCTTNETPLDFICYHNYGLDGSVGGLDPAGQKRYFINRNPLAQVDQIISSGPFLIAKSARPNLPTHVTEWNTSWAKFDHVHDSYFNATQQIGQLREIEKSKGIASLSRWTFTDIFEEDGIPPSPFWGGFGLVNLQGIKKASFFAFKYLAELGATELVNADKQSWVTRDDKGGVQALFYDLAYPMKEPLKQSNNEFFGNVHPPLSEAPAKLVLSKITAGKYKLVVRRTGFKKNDAFTKYIEMGSPKDMSLQQVADLKELASDKPESTETVIIGAKGLFERTFTVRSNDIYMVTLTPVRK